MNKINSYRDLKVWQKSMTLITTIYSITKTFPQTEVYGLTSQMRRAACSIALNIAERYRRESFKNYIQFLKIFKGSVLDLETCIFIANNLSYISSDQSNNVVEKIEERVKMLNALIKSLNNKATSLENLA